MRQTPSETRMNDMVTIDKIVFEIVGGGAFIAPPPRIVNFLKKTDRRIGLRRDAAYCCRYRCILKYQNIATLAPV